MSVKKGALGICCGVIAFILTAWAINFLYELEIVALSIGAVIGLEIGFFTADFTKSWQVHKRCFSMFFGVVLKEILFALSALTLYVGLCIATYYAWHYMFFMQGHHILGTLYSWGVIDNPFLPQAKSIITFEMTYCFAIGVLYALVFFGITCEALENGRNYWLTMRYLTMRYLTAYAIAVSLLGPIVAVLVVTVAVVVVCVVAPIFILLFALGILSSILVLSADKVMSSVAIGVLVGGFTGIIYGKISTTEFSLVLQMCLVGCFVGLVSGGISVMLGKLKPIALYSYKWKEIIGLA